MSALVILGLPLLLAAALLSIALEVTRPPEAAPAPRPRPPGRLSALLAQAGLWRVRPGAFVACCLGAGSLCGSLVAVLSGAVWVGCAFGVLGGWLPVAAIRARRAVRLRELATVWPDAIDHLDAGIRAGMSLPEAVAGLAERGPAALRGPARRFAVAYQAGGRFQEALDHLGDELGDPTADRVIECLRLAREVGGTELGRTLRTLASFLRDEQRTRRELEARQTWVVVSARLAYAMPWVILLLLATRPEAAEAYGRPAGAAVIAAGACAATLGYRLMLAIGRLPAEARVLGGDRR